MPAEARVGQERRPVSPVSGHVGFDTPLLVNSGCHERSLPMLGFSQAGVPRASLSVLGRGPRAGMPGTCPRPTASLSCCSEVLGMQERLGHLRPLPGRGAGDPGTDLGRMHSYRQNRG